MVAHGAHSLLVKLLDMKRIIEILDTKYDKANLPEIVKDTCPHLEPSQRDMLLSLLLDFESLFDGPTMCRRYGISSNITGTCGRAGLQVDTGVNLNRNLHVTGVFFYKWRFFVS
jgi:hypothetical protein